MDQTNTFVKVKDLKRGDVVIVRLPFEENTPDYYNGHNVFDIVTRLTKDKNGRHSKVRPAVVIGNNGDGDIYVAPMTSTSHSKHDKKHQMEITNTPEVSENTRSYIEVTNMRHLTITPEGSIRKVAELSNNDMSRLKTRYEEVRSKGLVTMTDKNTYTFIPNKDKFSTELLKHGFEMVEPNTWKKANTTVSYDDEIHIASYRKDVSLEDVLRRTHPRAHLTMRTSDRKPVSPTVELLVSDVEKLLKQNRLALDFHSTTYLPGGLDGMTTRGRTTLQVRAGNDHGAISELGAIILNGHKLGEEKLDDFVTWYEETRGLSVTYPREIKPEDAKVFEGFGLSQVLTEEDLYISNECELKR